MLEKMEKIVKHVAKTIGIPEDEVVDVSVTINVSRWMKHEYNTPEFTLFKSYKPITRIDLQYYIPIRFELDNNMCGVFMKLEELEDAEDFALCMINIHNCIDEFVEEIKEKMENGKMTIPSDETELNVFDKNIYDDIDSRLLKIKNDY